MLKRIFTAVLLFIIFSVNCCALGNQDISAECAVVMDAKTGKVIFEKNSYKRHSMASTTKIMTSLIAIESGRLSDEIKVTDDMIRVEGTSMGLEAGDSVSLKELVYGMMLPSGNDAANATAIHLGGNVEKFTEIMNNKAKSLGMKNTCFVTPSGLDDKNHFSTAYDMALLCSSAVKNKMFLSVCSSMKVKLTYGNPPYIRYLTNHNRLLSEYDGALGVKTGFTKKSGRCLCSYAIRDGVELIAVTLNDPDDWNDHRKMLDFGFECSKMKTYTINIPSEMLIVGGNVNSVKLKSVTYSSTAENLKFRIYINKFIYAPVNAGESVGYIDVILNGKVIDKLEILTDQKIDVI